MRISFIIAIATTIFFSTHSVFSEKPCCGSQGEYDPATEECCNNMKIVEIGRCCGDRWALPDGYECCESGEAPQVYNTYGQCCEESGVLSKTIIGNLNDCPNRVSKTNYTPISNGCSSPLGNNPVSGSASCLGQNTSFLDACNSHDICYGTCLNVKSDCDAVFYADMMAVCDQVSSPCYVDCIQMAAHYYTAVFIVGNSFYNNGQEDGCQCCP